jgi:hypothetical protein
MSTRLTTIRLRDDRTVVGISEWGRVSRAEGIRRFRTYYEHVRAMGGRAPFPAPEVLHAAQVAWRAEQCASLARYFTEQGKPQDVRGEWPVLPIREEVRA